ncbi:MAG: hypothetical protein AAGA54_24230 [Myxococcota bacterium]
MSLLSSLLTLPLALGVGLACELEKEDGMDTGAVDDDLDEDDLDEDEDDSESTASTSAGSGDDGDDSDSDSDAGADTGDDSDTTTAGTGDDDSDSGDDDSDSDTTTDGDSDSDTDGDSDTDDTAGTGEGGEGNALAIRHGDLPELDPGKGGSSSTGGPKDSIPADAIHVIVSASGVKTCEQPYEGEPCGGNWSVSFLLMPDMQAPGEYNLFEQANGGFTYADEPYEEGDCAWGGGSLDGVLVIESVDDDAIIGYIEESDAFDFDADISFVAELCGA